MTSTRAELDLARTVLTVTPHVYRTVGRAVRAQNLVSFDRFKVLMRLDRHPEGLRSGELATHWRLTAPAMTKLVDELERDGFVRRSPDPTDGRAVVLKLTAEGRREFQRFFDVAATALADLLGALTADERDRLQRALTDLARVLEASAALNGHRAKEAVGR